MRAILRVPSLVVLAALMASWPAVGQEALRDRAAADALFAEAKRLMESERYAEACPKLEDSQRFDPAVGTLMYLAHCYEKTNRAAAAWEMFRKAEAAARDTKHADRERKARERAEALEASLSSLRIEVPEAARVPGLEVQRDGVPLKPSAFGAAIPVDPGVHVVTAAAPGRKSWTKDIEFGATRSQQVLELPVLEPEAQAVAPAVQAPPASSGRSAAPAPESAESMPGSAPALQRNMGWVLTAVGVAGLGAGGYFAWQARSKEQDSDRHCMPENRNWCDATGIALNKEAQDAQRVSVIAFAAGAVAAAAGLTLVLTAPRAPSATHVAVSPSLGPSAGAMVLTGQW